MNLYATTLPEWTLCCFRPAVSPDGADEPNEPRRTDWSVAERVSSIEEDAERWDGLA